MESLVDNVITRNKESRVIRCMCGNGKYCRVYIHVSLKDFEGVGCPETCLHMGTQLWK
jgi:hypothetical protein